MAMHYNCQQFNQAFQPKRLGNWEIPRDFPRAKPFPRAGRTQIIANDRGHLLPGIPRPTAIGTGPWGHFIPTWRMPKKITKEIAKTLRDPRPKSEIKLDKPKHDIIKEAQKVVEEKKPVIVEEEQIDDDHDPCEGMVDKTKDTKQVCPIHDG